MQSATVSVVLPTWNGLPYLREAVASVQAQTFCDWELIVVDDGSTDDTVSWLRTIEDPRVRVLAEPHTANLSRVRNRGHRAARGRWIALLDSDDVWEPEKLKHQVAYHRDHPEILWSYTGWKLIDANSGILPDANYPSFVPIGGWVLLPLLEREAAIASTVMLIDRALLEEIGGLAEHYPYAGDYDLQLRLAMRAECGVVDEPLTRIRQHAGSRTSNNPDATTMLADIYRDFGRRAPSAEAAARSRRQQAFYRLKAARLRFNRGEWARGWHTLLDAARIEPWNPRLYRVAADGLRRMSRAAVP